jgi:hypothetical protein
MYDFSVNKSMIMMNNNDTREGGGSWEGSDTFMPNTNCQGTEN